MQALETRRLLAGVPSLILGAASAPANLVACGNSMYFTATSAATGRELWKTDGTAAGTVLVKDIRSGAFDSSPASLTVVGNTLYFSANDGVNGAELWKSDGTAAGTVLVKDIRSGAAGSSPASLAVVGNTLYFSANDGVNGEELWKSDGTAAGTVLVKDIRAGNLSSYAWGLTTAGTTIYFRADDGLSGSELWKTDGTAAGTVLVKDIRAGRFGSGLSSLTAVGNSLYFFADDGVTGNEFWKSDGTSAGTVLMKDLNPGSSAYNQPYYGDEGPAYRLTYIPNYSQLVGYASIGSLVYFSTTSRFRSPWGGYDESDPQLWKSDGTAEGTGLVLNKAGISPPIAIGNTLYLDALLVGAEGWYSMGWELCKSDGTAAGTVVVKDINPGVGGSLSRSLTAVGTTLYFTAVDDVHGGELWKTDGTAAGTALVKDIRVGNIGSGPSSLTAVGNTLYFTADDGFNGRGLWVLRDNQAPTSVNLSATTIAENLPAGTVVGTLSTSDPDTDDTFTYVIVPDANLDGTELFEIVGNQLRTKVPFDFEAKSSYSIRIRSTDSGGLFTGRTFTIKVDNINDAPASLAISAASVVRTRPAGTVVGTFSTTDQDAGDSFSYALIPDPNIDGTSLFEIVGNQLRTKAVFPSTALASYSIHVRSTDSSGLHTGRVFTIAVTPPAAPVAVTNVLGRPGAGLVTLSWTAPASDGGAVVKDYIVQYSGNGGATWRTFVDAVSAATTARVTGLVNGTGYLFRVLAKNAVGIGLPSAASAAVAPRTLPGAPVRLVVAARNGAAALTWSPPASTGGAPITDYLVEYSRNNGSTWRAFSDTVTSTRSALVTGLTNGVAYVFRVRAVNAAGPGAYTIKSAAIRPRG